GTLLERCYVPVDLANPTPGSVVIQSTNCRTPLLDHDPRAIPFPQSVADAFDLPELVRLLERPVRVAALDDLLGDTPADAFELHQLLDVRGVDVDRRRVRRGRCRRSGV